MLQLRSTSDPSLIVDAASLWSQPETVLARFGPQAETDLLLALRRGAAVWPPLAQVLEQASPSAIDLDDDALTSLLGPAAEALAGAGIEVMWPSSMLDDGLELRAAVTPAPEQLTEAGLGLAALLEFRWQLTLDGALLDADEIAALAAAKRPLIRLRGRWVILDPALLDRLRRPPRTRMRATEALGAVLAGEAEIDGKTVKVAAEGPLADLAARIASLGSAPEPVEPPPGLNATLRPYQQRGLAWLAGMCDSGLGGCLADDMGLGKTIQIIALHLHRRDLKAGPTLVVCPASLLGTWQREIRRFAPDIPVRRFHGGGRHLQDLALDEVVLVTYGVVLRDSERLAETGWGLVVADEAQHAKNPFSRTARELRAIPAPARIALTGTPVENRLSELWSILDWTTPGLLGHLEAFTRRIARPVELYRDADATAAVRRADPAVPAAAAEDRSRYRARTAAQDRDRPAGAADRRTGHAVRGDGPGDDAGDRHRGGHRACRAGVQAAHRTQADLQPPGAVPEAARATTRPFGKTGFVRRTDDVILAGGESMLVFTQYTQMATLLQQHLDARGIRSLFLHGGVPVQRREEMVAEFQAGGVPVFLLSLKAGGTGLTLTRATHVLHYDRWWNPAVEDQATDRAYRIGQDRPVQVHRLIAEGTLEDRIAALLEKKRDLADAVIGSGERWIAELSDSELTELVSLRAAS